MKSLFAGIALAAISGVLLGGAMKPTLGDDDRPAGPQMFAGWSGARSTGPFDDGATFVGYAGKVPDYVLGTDIQKASVEPQDIIEPEEALAEVAAADTEPQRVAFVASEVEAQAPQPVGYPSMTGGVSYAPQPVAPANAPVAQTVASLG